MTTLETVNLIINGLLGSGMVSMMLFYRSKRRQHNAEASTSEFNALKLQINHFSQQLKEAYTEIDHMQEIIDRKRNELLDVSKKLSELRMQLIMAEERKAVAEYNMCDVPDCPNRRPPRIKSKPKKQDADNG